LGELWPKLRLVAQAALRKVHSYDEGTIIEKPAFQALADCPPHFFTKQMSTIRDNFRKESLGVKYITLQLADRKAIMNKINSINLNVQSSLKHAAKLTEDLLVRRDAASEKIKRFYAKAQFKRRNMLSHFKHDSVYMDVRARFKFTAKANIP